MVIGRLCALLLTAMISLPSMAAQAIQVLPQSLVEDASGWVATGVEPCGATFIGHLLTSSQAQLSLSALYTGSTVSCSSLPKLVQRRVRHVTLPASRMTQVSPPAPLGQRLVLTDVTQVQVLERGQGIRLTYVSQCASRAGIVIHETEGGALEVGVAEWQPIRPRVDGGTSCHYDEKTVTLKYARVDLAKTPVVGLRRAMFADLGGASEELFSLRMAQVRGVAMDARGSVSLQYQRRCNEAPVGIVVAPTVAPKGRGHLAVGLVLATYPGYPCDPDALGRLDEVYESPPILDSLGGTESRQAGRIASLDAAGLTKVTLQSPSQYGLAERGDIKAMRVEARSSCSTLIGALVSVDSHGALSLGLVREVSEDQVGGQPKCEINGGSEVSHYSYLTKILGTKEQSIYPLKIRGIESFY